MVAILAAVGLTSLAGLASLGIFVAATVWDSRSGNNKNIIMNGINDKIEFFGSQLGGQQVINYSYTDEPWRLLAYDIYYFLAYWRNWIYILYPATPTDSGDLDELSPTRGNLICIAVHAILVIAQLFFIFSLPFTFIFPLWMVAIWIVGFITCNELVCGRFLNGEGTTYHSDPKYAPSLPKHAHEQWIFLNGVAVGSHWMRSNLNRLALTFKRPILGIHNRTHGILFDVIECLIQRNLTYATGDVRMCYSMLKEKLYDPSLTKVIFICHSQGGIEGGLVLDWLIQELPQDMLAKLEVYTFGCAANHFNNPHRHFLSQKMAHDDPAAVTATTTTTAQVKGGGTTTEDLTAAASLANSVPIVDGTSGTALTESPTQFSRTAITGSAPVASSTNSQNPPHLDTELTHRAAAAVSTRSTMSAAADRAIGHIEHYAHTSDFVARWGVLHFTSSPTTTSTARYMGRVFARSSARGGHQFCLHYLDGMFPLVRDDKTGEFVGALEEGNRFMESEVALQADGEREGEEVSAGSAGGCMMDRSRASGGHRTGTWASGVEVSGFGLSAGVVGGKKKVKELSRLWGYVNGKSPEDVGATVAIGQRIDLWGFKSHV